MSEQRQYLGAHYRGRPVFKSAGRRASAVNGSQRTCVEVTSLANACKRLENWLVLSDDERHDIAELSCSELHLPPGGIFGARDQAKRSIAILVAGHMCSYDVLPNGSRHISGFYYPGEILNYHSFAVGRPLYEYIAVGNVIVCLIEEGPFSEFLMRRPAIAQLLQLIETARLLFLTDRFRAATRLEGEQRVLHVLLEMKAVEEIVAADRQNEMTLQFTQEQIADMMGLTPVYVSKMLTRLERNGSIERVRRAIKFQSRANAELETGFINRYRQIDGWRRIGA